MSRHIYFHFVRTRDRCARRLIIAAPASSRDAAAGLGNHCAQRCTHRQRCPKVACQHVKVDGGHLAIAIKVTLRPAGIRQFAIASDELVEVAGTHCSIQTRITHNRIRHHDAGGINCFTSEGPAGSGEQVGCFPVANRTATDEL